LEHGKTANNAHVNWRFDRGADFISNSENYYGWGDAMPVFFKPNVRVVNFALTMQSSGTFLRSIQKDNMLLIKPEFVLLQLGTVDTYPILETTLAEYETNLKKIVQMIRGFEGTPILVTPTAPMIFDNGVIFPLLQERADVVRKVAAELQTYLVDLNRLTTDLYNSLGPADSAYIAWPGDPGHFSQAGSEVVSELVVEALPPILRFQAVH
jgi:lysophospholipase L1-like esterase